jgi:hypothetical protein
MMTELERQQKMLSLLPKVVGMITREMGDDPLISLSIDTRVVFMQLAITLALKANGNNPAATMAGIRNAMRQPETLIALKRGVFS